MKKSILLLFIISLTFSVAASFAAAPKKIINILTWWGYLDYPDVVSTIEKKCDATISYDTYTSNDDMLRKWNGQIEKYDVLIFSNTIYDVIKDDIKLENSSLSKQAIKYNPTIRKKFIDSNFSPNIAYFIHSLTGFIWNPKIINLSENDTIDSIFEKSKNNKIILLDDAVEINMLLSESIISPNIEKLSLMNFKKLTKDSQVFISNELNQVFQKNDFAFAYGWSGEAFSNEIANYKYNFLIHKKMSYISTDLVAQLKNESHTACIALFLSSEAFLSAVQNKFHYFSPYGNLDTVPEGEFKERYKEFILKLPNLNWIKPVSTVALKALDQQWDSVKYDLIKKQ